MFRDVADRDMVAATPLSSPGLDPGPIEPALYIKPGLEAFVAFFLTEQEWEKAGGNLEHVAPIVIRNSSDDKQVELRELKLSKVDLNRLNWALNEFISSTAVIGEVFIRTAN